MAHVLLSTGARLWCLAVPHKRVSTVVETIGKKANNMVSELYADLQRMIQTEVMRLEHEVRDTGIPADTCREWTSIPTTGIGRWEVRRTGSEDGLTLASVRRITGSGNIGEAYPLRNVLQQQGRTTKKDCVTHSVDAAITAPTLLGVADILEDVASKIREEARK